MRKKVVVSAWGQVLFTALGLGSIAACGGAVTGGTGGSAGASGSQGTGGTQTSGTGGIPGTGGIGTGTGGIPGTGGTGTGGIPGTGGAPPSFACTGSVPLGGMALGFERCSNGLVHRAQKQTCATTAPRPGILYVPGEGGILPQFAGCTRDSDCANGTNGPHGYCTTLVEPGPTPYATGCEHGCVTDEECPSGFICQCGDPVGQCVRSSCVSDADCGQGLVCGVYAEVPGCPGVAFACQTGKDTCATDADCVVPCPPETACPRMPQCTYLQRFTCSTPMCIVGRPFLVGGTARTANTARRADWLAPIRVVAASHDAEREPLARAWTEMALMEHASIAAFARFALQLLALGAPPDLIEGANAAQADETRHARMCFAIASAHAGHDVGPGALRLDGALQGASLADVLVNVIEEGCIGETVAALEAAEALEHATDPAARDALTVISHDELRHAELAWRFVRWAMAHGGREARQAASAAFQKAAREQAERDARRRLQRPAVASASPSLLGGGILADEIRAELRYEAMLMVILPCARRILAGEGQSAARIRDELRPLTVANDA